MQRLLKYLSTIYILAGVIAASSTVSAAPDLGSTPVIENIIIRIDDIFDTEQEEFDYWYYRLANRLHIKTKKFVIAREVLLSQGDQFDRDLAEETARNLRALPFVYESKVYLDTLNGEITLIVVTSDRWTLAAGPRAKRSSGQNVFGIRIEELNLLGFGQQIDANYYFREFDKNYLKASFNERRLFSSRQSLYIFHNGDPEIGLTTVSLSRPYYQLNDKFNWSLTYTYIDREDRYYVDGNQVSRNDFIGRRTNLGLNYRWGEYLSKVRVGLSYQYTDLRSSNEQVFIDGLPVLFPEDSLYHSVTSTFEISRREYFQTTRIDNLKRIEDIALFNYVAISLGWHYDGRSHDLLYRTLTFSAQMARYWKSNLFTAYFGRTYWMDGNVKIRKTTAFSMSLYNNHLEFLTPVLYVSYSIDDRLQRRLSLAVGEDNGVRGYPRDYITGEKLLQINMENRIFTGINILSAEIGLVQIIDGAQGMLRNQNIDFNKIYWAFGGGIRIGSEKIGNADIVRIDLAYAEKIKEWQISFGVGQYF